MLPLNDTTMRAVEYALDGLKTRQDVHANNIAHVNTPGFRADRVDFESHLRTALSRGPLTAESRMAGPSVNPADTIVDPFGNSVDLADEMTEIVKSNLTQDAMVRAYNFKVNVLRTAIGNR